MLSGCGWGRADVAKLVNGFSSSYDMMTAMTRGYKTLLKLRLEPDPGTEVIKNFTHKTQTQVCRLVYSEFILRISQSTCLSLSLIFIKKFFNKNSAPDQVYTQNQQISLIKTCLCPATEWYWGICVKLVMSYVCTYTSVRHNLIQ